MLLDVQTNLQLYRQLIAASWGESELALIRRGYELALQLFADAYRASRRPFVAHLVGTASALAAWKERPAVVAAGLLHSAYLYGHFGDGRKGITGARRRIVENIVGAEVEQLVHDYTLADSTERMAHWSAQMTLTPSERDQAALQLANLYDDWRDGEPLIVLTKKRPLDLPWSASGRQAVALLAERAVGPAAAAAMGERFEELDAFCLPDCLKNTTRPPRRVTPGLSELSQPTIVRYARNIFPFLQKKRAA